LSDDREVGFRRAARALVVLVVAVAQLVLVAHAESVFSGANGRIAFSAGGGIYTVRPDGTGLKPLAAGFGSQWSPDGNRIAFVAVRDRYFDIHVMNADGANQANLTRSPGVHDRDFAWSPDGTKLAFVRDHDTGDGEVYVMNSDGTGKERLTSPGFGEADAGPRWSPDGRKLVFGRIFGFQSFNDVFSINADGSGATNLTNFQATRSDPQTWATAGGARWSPDGTRIVFHQSSRASGWSNNVWTMNPDGSDKRRLTAGLNELRPEWSPDSARIVFQSPFDISTVDRNGSGQVALTSSSDDESWPQWSPDGRRIVFQRTLHTPDGGSDGSDVYAMNADGTAQVNLTAHVGGFAGGADWQPLVRSAFRNGAEFCRALRDATGDEAFKETHRTFGKCVSEN
jgi:TolB protein